MECKPSTGELNVNHASQLYRYFSVTDARIGILTNGVVYQFYSDIDQPNRMDAKPFFTFSMDAIRKVDLRILEQFTKASFDIDRIVQEAANLKLESLIRKEIEQEMASPSDELTRLIGSRVHEGRFSSSVRDTTQRLVASAFAAILRDSVNDRLTSALNASALPEEDEAGVDENGDAVITTQEEISGYRIVQAIAAKSVDPKRIVMRDAKSYCAILLDDNNRKSIARLYFNSPTTRYVSTFSGKDEAKVRIERIDRYLQAERRHRAAPRGARHKQGVTAVRGTGLELFSAVRACGPWDPGSRPG